MKKNIRFINKQYNEQGKQKNKQDEQKNKQGKQKNKQDEQKNKQDEQKNKQDIRFLKKDIYSASFSEQYGGGEKKLIRIQINNKLKINNNNIFNL